MSRAELDALLDVVLPFARDQLGKRGEFAPFAASLGRDGAPKLAMADGKDSNEMIAMVREGLRKERASLRAVAVCYDVRVREDALGAPEAVAVALEEADGSAILVLMPYRRRGGRELEFLPLVAQPGEAVVFAP